MSGEFRVIAVGKLKSGPEAELFARYAERMTPKLGLTEIADARGSLAEIKRREAEALLAALPARAQVVALDLSGPVETSEGFAQRVAGWREHPDPVCFLIGGAEGLDKSVILRAQHLVGLGKFTWPHLLARAMLAEQLFRAQCILGGHPYHKKSRPA